MRKIYPTELIDFLQCRHKAYLKKQGVKGEEFLSEEVEMLRKKGLEHEKAFLESLEDVVKIDPEATLEEQSRQTREAMENGAGFIYQAFLENDILAGYPDFLEKVEKPSALGDFSYRILDTKLSNTPTAANAVQLIHYSQIAEQIQNTPVDELLIIHGDQTRSKIDKSDYKEYYDELLNEYRTFINGSEHTEPYPVPACKNCEFQRQCEEYWTEKDHLARINGIKPYQIARLHEAEIADILALLEIDWTEKTALSLSSFSDLKMQALAQKNGEIRIKNKQGFEALQEYRSGGVLLTFFRQFDSRGSADSFYSALKIFPGDRFEEVFIENASEEAEAFHRIVNFVVRYRQKRPMAHLFVWSLKDIKFLHDLSNKYNLCHDEIDELILNKKIVAVQSLLSNAFYLPVADHSLQSMMNVCSSGDEKLEILKKSPVLLSELLRSAGVESAGAMISKRARAELEAIEKLFCKLCEYEITQFPLKLCKGNIDS